MRRLAPLAVLAPVALGLALASAAPAHAAPSSGFVRTDDGVRLAYDLYRPAGAAPRGGRPAVVVLHGLGGSKDSMAQVARVFAARGYVALAYSVRGQGTSGGDFTLASPRDVRDLREVVAWLRRQPGVSGKVGCFGISLGGGECWNATPGGIFDAVVPVASWTDLATALWPGDVARSGIVAAFAQTVAPRSPLVRSISTDAVRSLEMGAIRALAARRSVLPRLARARTPVSIFQGRVDYAFDIDQALLALGRLRGPKRLYVGDFGHPPSSFASPDFPGYVLERSLAWFDRFLRGRPNGVDRSGLVTLADRTGTRRVAYPAAPPTRTAGIRFGGAGAVRTAAPLGRAVETFGGSVLRVQVRSVARYPRLVAVLLAGGVVVTHGAVVPHRGPNTIRLADYAVYLPRGTRLRLRLGPDGGLSDLAYLGFGGGGSIRLGAATLSLRTLATPVSR